MPRRTNKNLFPEPEEEPTQATPAAPGASPEVFDEDAPLAERMRPRTLQEFVGQQHLIGEGRPLRRMIEGTGQMPSLILWGAPGTGKTTLARMLARRKGARFVPLSAVFSGVREVRACIAEARQTRGSGERTILFIDEIHRFNKAQQDALLPAVEDGTVTLIGATTENPSFEVIGALLSRARVLMLEPLNEADVETILRRALEDPERGLANLHPQVADEALARLRSKLRLCRPCPAMMVCVASRKRVSAKRSGARATLTTRAARSTTISPPRSSSRCETRT
jgi:putative ATPase